MISKKVLENMYLERHMTMTKIAKQFGISRSTVSYWLNTYRIEKRKGRLRASISKSELEDMYYKRHMTMFEIAGELGVAGHVIFYQMHEYGIKSRNFSEALKGLMSGELHPNWKGGISFEPYCNKFNNEFKEIIRNRDDNTCQLCGYVSEPEDRKLCIHHVHYDKLNCYPDVITLCVGCNIRVNYNRNYYEKYFEDLLRQRGLLYEELL